LLAAGEPETPARTCVVFAVVQKDDPALRRFALSRLQELRAADFGGVELSASASSFGSSMKAQLREANQQGADWVLIVGEDELKGDRVTLKPFKDDGEQRAVPSRELAEHLRGELRRR
jgi:histidyl-tRNA synthetase